MDPVVVWVVRVALALLFAAAALHKLRARAEFAATLEAYALLPEHAVRPVAWALPGVEAALGALLLAPPAAPLAGASGAALLAVYSAAIAVNLARGRTDIDCGCLGPALRSAQPSLSPWLLVRNALLIGACLLLVVPHATRPLVWVDGLSIVAGVASATLCWIATHQLVSLPALRRAS